MKINYNADERALRVALSKKSKAVLIELLIQKIYELCFLHYELNFIFANCINIILIIIIK